MKGRIIAGLAGLALIAPATAHGTGDYIPKPRPEPCPQCCRDTQQQVTQLGDRITLLEQTIRVQQQQIEQQNNWINEVNNRVTTVVNRVQVLSCQSDRVYEFRARAAVDGSRVVAVDSVEVIGQPVTQAQDTDRGSWHRNGGGRFVITANYSGIDAPAGQVRTVTVFLRTADGRRYRTTQKLRLCLEDDGNMNDRSTQGRADD